MSRITKEQKGLTVLSELMNGRKTLRDLVDGTGLVSAKVRHGIEWIRDYEPHALVVQREGRQQYYKLAETSHEVSEHINNRAKTLYRQALRLERMVSLAYDKWPDSQLLKIMNRHLSRMREDIEELV